MENGNFVYKGWKCNGFLALVLIFGGLALGVYAIVAGAQRIDAGLALGGGLVAAGVVWSLCMLICMAGFMLLEPNEARVMVFFGKYKGTFYETGYWWVNPFMSAKQISIRARNLNVDPIKVNDKTGNPILIGLVLVWKIKRDDIYKAVFEIDAPTTAGQTGVSATARMNILENFVGVQSDAALRQVAGCYSYDNNGVADDELTLRSNSEQIKRDDIYKAVFEIDAPTTAGQTGVSATARMNILENFVGVQSDAALRQVAGCYSYDNNGVADDELTLRSNSEQINDQLEHTLNERLAMAGIEVVEARINYLAYAPEIAAVMLRRQQADAIISAREKIVEGAVSMVHMALDRLGNEHIVELDEERKAAMVSNLLVVLCADEAAQPVVNAGTLHH